MSKNKKFLVLLLVFLMGFGTYTQLSLLPGPEGAKVGVYSVQNPITKEKFVVGKESDSYASFMPSDPYNVHYDPDKSNLGYPDNYVSLSKIWSEGEKKEDINYWVKNGDEWVHVEGYVEVLYFNIEFRAEPSGDAAIPPVTGGKGDTEYENRWSATTFWFATGPTIWNKAYPDPMESRKGGRVWASPLTAYTLATVIAEGSSKYIYLNPEGGKQVTLFSDSSGGSIVDIIGNVEPTNLNETLKNEWGAVSPDSRLKTGIGFFQFTYTDFGCEYWYSILPPQFGYKTPKIQYTIKIFYLVVGQWIYTNYEYEEWILGQSKKDEPKNFWEMIGEWWTGVVQSPLTYIWTAIGGFFFIIVAVIFVAIFAPSLLRGIGNLLGGRKRD